MIQADIALSRENQKTNGIEKVTANQIYGHNIEIRTGCWSMGLEIMKKTEKRGEGPYT